MSMLMRIWFIVILMKTILSISLNSLELDFVIEKETSTETVFIEVFKSTSSDFIIDRKEQDKYKSLEWMSIGDPKLVLRNNSSPFSFKLNGF